MGVSVQDHIDILSGLPSGGMWTSRNANAISF